MSYPQLKYKKGTLSSVPFSYLFANTLSKTKGVLAC